ncbi:MAG: right-handed parallel beta-helix repeat-containing protein [Thermoproteota archaeon]
MHRKRISLLLIGTLFFISAFNFMRIVSASTTIIVNPGDSIQVAINNATSGSTILIKNGTYMEYRIIVNKTVTIIGESKEGTIVDGEANSDASVIFHVIANNVKISNLTVQNASREAIPLGPAGIIIANALMVEISDCIIRSSATGLRLLNSNNSRIERNTISHNTAVGIDLQPNSTNNYIVNNDIFNNPVGILVEQNTRFNKIYHNNFVDNSKQVDGFGMPTNTWDNGYPSGGNYWSDYTGVDFYSGTDQNVTGSDGIGDTSANNDRYPFMGKLYLFWAGEWSQTNYYVMITSNSSFGVSNFLFSNNTSPPYLKFDSEGLESRYGFSRVAIPKQLLWVDNQSQWLVLVNETSVTPSIAEDLDYTYIYLTYSHSLLTIQIYGIHAIPETTTPALIALMILFAIQILLTKKTKIRKLSKQR